MQGPKALIDTDVHLLAASPIALLWDHQAHQISCNITMLVSVLNYRQIEVFACPQDILQESQLSICKQKVNDRNYKGGRDLATVGRTNRKRRLVTFLSG
jgi:hypothetical protein